MNAFHIHQGSAVSLLINDIDTDQLIPKQYLKGTEKTGYAGALFDTWRYHPDGSEIDSFPLNQPQHKDATVLIAGDNFGCGSSREHAAWALQDYGFEAIIAGSYSPIFYMNWLNNGHLPIVLSENERKELAELPPGTQITIDLPAQTVQAADKSYFFEIEAGWKKRLMEGKDSISLTLEHEDAIAAYEASAPVWRGGLHES